MLFETWFTIHAIICNFQAAYLNPCKLLDFFIISVTLWKIGKHRGFYFSLFWRDYIGVIKLIKNKFKGFGVFEHLFWTFCRFFTRRNKNGKNKRNAISVCVYHQREKKVRSKHSTCSEKWSWNGKLKAGNLSLLDALDIISRQVILCKCFYCF